MLQWKIFMVMALIGHILCGISDGFLTYAPNGKVDLTNFKDYEKSKVAFHGMPLKNLSVAMLLGVCAMTLEIFGYIALCDWMRQYFLLLLWQEKLHFRHGHVFLICCRLQS